VHPAIRRLVDDGTLLAVAAGIALGWSAFRLADAIGTLVVSIASKPPFPASEFSSAYPLTARIGDRVLVFGPLLEAGVTLVLLLAVVLAVYGVRAKHSG
jgi:hypothetical protein